MWRVTYHSLCAGNEVKSVSNKYFEVSFFKTKPNGGKFFCSQDLSIRKLSRVSSSFGHWPKYENELYAYLD